MEKPIAAAANGSSVWRTIPTEDEFKEYRSKQNEDPFVCTKLKGIYVTPDSTRVRDAPGIIAYLKEHPEYSDISPTDFCFTSPKVMSDTIPEHVEKKSLDGSVKKVKKAWSSSGGLFYLVIFLIMLHGGYFELLEGRISSVIHDSQSTLIVSAAKLPILNPNEFDLCKMRIDQYFLMTDYSLWEVILNGDSPVPTKVVDGVVQPVSYRKGVVIRDLEEKSTAIIPAETKSKDKGKGIMVEEPKPIKKKDQVKLDEEYARKLHEKLNKDIDWDMAIEHMKQKDKEDSSVQRYQFLLKSKEQIEEEENRAIKSINETLAQKATKRRKLNEEVKEIKDLKQHLEIVPNEDNDVYTEATPLARKTRRTIANLKESKECTWSCKALELMLPWSLKKNTKCFNAVGEELSDVKHKLMLLDTVVKRRLMLMSQDKTVNKNCSR
nr:hypothetical protein [Tanacetum cinerariifolium]